jgi:phenylalanyl-tRNA synthetase beta chain
VLEINISTLAEKFVSQIPMFTSLPLYPEVTRDFAFWVETQVTHEAISKAIYKTGQLVKKVELFDIYHDKEKNNQKSVAYRVTFSDSQKTLTTEEVNGLTEKITQVLKEDFKASLRT